MKTTDIRKAIVLAAGQVVVKRETLASTDIAWVLDQHFPDKTLTVATASIQSQPADDFVLVGGTIKLFGVEVTGTVKFYLDGNDAQLVLEGALPTGWRFGDSFEDLKNDYFNDFSLSTPKLRLRSKASQSKVRGLWLDAGFTLPPAFEVLKWFVDPGAEAKLSGPISLDDGLPVMTLSVSPKITASLGGYLDIDLQMQHLAKTYPHPRSKPVVSTISQLAGDLSFTRNSQPVDVPIAVFFNQELTVLNFQMLTGKVFDLGLSEIAHWFNGVDLGSEGMPKAYNPVGLTLHDVCFAIGMRTQLLEYVSLNLQSTEPWQIVPSKVVIDKIQIDFMVVQPQKKPANIQATIVGGIKLGTVILDVYAQMPDFLIKGSLAENSPVDLLPLIDYLGGVSEGAPADLKIDVLNFEAHPAGSFYSFEINVSGGWQIVKDLALKDIYASIAYQGGGGEGRGVMADFRGMLALGGVVLEVSTEQDAEVEGWQFSGYTGPGQEIPIGRLIEDITGVEDLPAAIADFTISDLGVSFNTQSKDFSFTCKGQIPVGDSEEVEVTVTITCERDSALGSYRNTYEGDVILGDWQFTLKFSEDPKEKILVASLDKTGTKGVIQLNPDVGIFSAYLDQSAASERKSLNLGSLGSALPSELAELMGKVEITPLQMALGTHKDKASSNYVLALQLDGGLSLSRLPFVGERLPKGADVGMKDLGLVWCSAGLSGDKGKEARTAFVEAFQEVDLIDDDALSSGGMFSAWLTVPSQAEPFELGIPLRSPVSRPTVPARSTATPTTTPSMTSMTAAPSTAPPPPKTPDTVKWFKVGKNAGPLSLQRIGLKYEEKKVWFLFDASLKAGTVTLILDGLGAGLDPFALLGGRVEPEFTLCGLGLAIEGPAEISGAFLRDRIQDDRGDYDEFSGVVIVKTEALTLSGMGSYAEPPWSDPSFFAYAFLDKPIGGPPFFFVTGLALGIAINRSLDLPPIDQVSQFPLVRLALGENLAPPGANLPAIRDTGGDAELKTLLEVQQAMGPYTRPNSGQVVLAVGVRFTTFKILNSFGLLVASLEKPVKVDLLMSSRMQIPALPPGSTPSPAPPIAQIGIDLRGTWIPDDGVLGVEGRITEGSWFLDSACRLSGGAAFASWTSGAHNGDFVMTVGGYHPRFTVPAHYPKVPRLAFQWIRGPIEIKGDGYFAMTPSALMAGGSLSATYREGRLKAWFNCGADFLVAWSLSATKPACPSRSGRPIGLGWARSARR